MKTDRFSSVSTRAAAVLLAGLLLAAGPPAAGQRSIHIWGTRITIESDSKKLAKALAQQVGEVQKKFDENRRAIRTVPGPYGELAYTRQDVTGLIARTGEDLDQAIARMGEPGLEALRAWSAEQLRPIREGLASPVAQTADFPPGFFAPRAVAVVASLGSLPLAEPASAKAAPPKKKAPKAKPAAPKPAAPKQETIVAEKADGLLDQAGEVVSKIFFLASTDDLEVKLWVGSTPAQRAMFRFWPQGHLKGAEPERAMIRTNGKRDHVWRGLYSYNAAWTEGAVTQKIEYPNSAGTPVERSSEQLDLVKNSSFFCCEFNEQYCRHVANEKECRR